MESDSQQKQILKSTSIIGSSQIIVMFLSLLRNKFLSLLLGSAGIGLMGLYSSLLDTIKSVSTLGLQTSGVRYIAKYNLSATHQRQAQMIQVMRRWSLITAVAGALLCLLFAPLLSRWLHGEYVEEVRLLSLGVLFSTISLGQIATMQALKRVSCYVTANIIIGMLTLLSVVPFAWYMGMSGVVWILNISAIISYLVSRHYYYKVLSEMKFEIITWRQTWRKGMPMIQMGLLTVVTGLAASGSVFLIRMLIIESEGVQQAGVFHACWAISGGYVGIVLTSMCTDLFPRLAENSGNENGFSSLMDSQFQLVFYLVTPIVLGLLIFAPVAIPMLYSSEFLEGVTLLRWLMVAFLFRGVTLTMSYALLAKAARMTYLLVEVLFYVPFLSITYICYHSHGIEAIGVAYAISYLLYTIVLGLITYIGGYRMSRRTFLTALFYCLIFALAAVIVMTASLMMGYICGSVLLMIITVFSFVKLKEIFGL